MQSKRKIYLDTSVISAKFDETNPERKSLTEGFFQRIRDFDVFVSDLTIAEIEQTQDQKLRSMMLGEAKQFHALQANDEVRELVNTLMIQHAVPEGFAEDAFHIGFAVAYDMDFLLSWNFKHIVRRKPKTSCEW